MECGDWVEKSIRMLDDYEEYPWWMAEKYHRHVMSCTPMLAPPVAPLHFSPKIHVLSKLKFRNFWEDSVPINGFCHQCDLPTLDYD